MKTNAKTWGTTIMALATGTVLAAGAAPAPEKVITLKVGDAAPPLQVSKWVQGAPVTGFDRDHAYIVEFWATWCGPCRVSIPHLNEIHTKFKDKGLIVIGQDVWEKSPEAVDPFIKKMGDKMTYRVALDLVPDGEKAEGKMAATWMKAAGQNGIPTAFVLDKQSKIAWIGHPMELNESLVAQVLDGTFDVQKAAAEQENKLQSRQALMKLSRQFSANMQKKEWEQAEATLSDMEKLLPKDDRGGLGMMRFQMLMTKDDYAGATKLAGQLSAAQKDNAMLQNQLAWALLSHQGINDLDLDAVGTIATRANDAAKGKDAAILDTLARVTFMQGKKEKAIEFQEKAVALADDKMKDSLQKTLDSYKQGKLPKAE